MYSYSSVRPYSESASGWLKTLTDHAGPAAPLQQVGQAKLTQPLAVYSFNVVPARDLRAASTCSATLYGSSIGPLWRPSPGHPSFHRRWFQPWFLRASFKLLIRASNDRRILQRTSPRQSIISGAQRVMPERIGFGGVNSRHHVTSHV